ACAQGSGVKPGFALHDDEGQRGPLKEVLGSVAGMADANPRTFRSLIDRAKSNLWSPSRLREEGERTWGRIVAGLPLELVAGVYARYQARLTAANAVDFDDILGRTVPSSPPGSPTATAPGPRTPPSTGPRSRSPTPPGS